MPTCIRCKDCGFLSIRDARDSLVYPADERIRENAVTRNHTFSDGEIFGGASLTILSDRMICYVGYPALADDMHELRHAKTVIHKERECPHFIQWVPGKTPKEHEEMTILERVQAEYSQQRQEERQWQQQVEALAETRHQEQRHDNRQTVIWGLVVALVSAIIGGLISRQWGG